MNDGTEMEWLLQVDRMIDQVVAGRHGTGPRPQPEAGPLGADLALVTELSRLGTADWPADEVGQRITSSVTERAAASPQPPASAVPGHRQRPRGDRRWARIGAPIAAAAAVVAVVAGALAIVSGPHGRGAGGNPRARSVAPTASASPSASAHPAPGAPASPFRLAGTGNVQTSNFDCVTMSVCYAWFTGNAGNGPDLRTSDGGATWQQLASPPGGLAVTNQTQPSCPTAQVCYASTGTLTLAVTADGGASWSLDQLPAPPGGSGDTVDQVSCATARQCVAHVSSGAAGTFMSTANGDQTWTTASVVPPGAPGSLYYLRCDAAGDCIGVYPPASGTLQVLRSADNGSTWTVSSASGLPPATQFMMSCGDARHCMYVGDSGVAVTSDGGATWRQSAVPAAWNGSIAAVSCAAGLDCFAAVNNQTVNGGAAGPLIGTTRDGTTWTTQAAPFVDGAQLSEIDSLSCPGPGGCVALALDQAEAESGSNSSSGVQTSQRVVISSLSG